MDCGRPPGSTAMRLKAFVSAGPTARTTTTSPTSRRFRRLRSRPWGKRRQCRCQAPWASTSASPAATPITASLYADFQNDALEATNIDDDQIARGVSGGPGLDARDVNRLQRFRDFSADVGGYLKKDKAWWYGAYRSTEVAQQYPWLLDTAATLDATVVTGKVTYLLSRRQKLVGYLQHETFRQSSYFTASTSQPIADQ